ncbi:hypothetical protein NC653_014803 [Populus alba x Populus x berolinensis]|uniref:Uncharacterized protein n=1 Tax=Populus alba x Populus x berolinensis TaxID=444605 RepID=A0AAD6QZG2_9ROSI|nr:hypothetical protein NC653_014803 [Populus alba x Populus x berolinensis]
MDMELEWTLTNFLQRRRGVKVMRRSEEIEEY